MLTTNDGLPCMGCNCLSCRRSHFTFAKGGQSFVTDVRSTMFGLGDVSSCFQPTPSTMAGLLASFSLYRGGTVRV